MRAADGPPATALDTPEQVARRVRERRAQLRASMAALEAALANPAAGRLDLWRDTVVDACGALADALAEHAAETEAADGLLERIVTEAPRLANQVQRLRDDHVDMSDRCTDLAARLAAAADDDDVEDVRAAGVTLLVRLAHHRQAGSDLVYQAWMIDVGSSE